MAEQVEFPCIPECEPVDYRPVITSLLTFVNNESPTPEELQTFMSARSMFDEETAKSLLELIGVGFEKGEKPHLTDLGLRLYKAGDTDEFNKHLLEAIAERNPILLRVVFDSLSDRLQSDNELFRIITSHFYPGTPPLRQQFNNWFGWLEATQTIRQIGIRWCPAKLPKEIKKYLEGLNIDFVGQADVDEETNPEPAQPAPEETPQSESDSIDGEGEEDELTPDESGPIDGLHESVDDHSHVGTETAEEPDERATDPEPTPVWAVRLQATPGLDEVRNVLRDPSQGPKIALQATVIDEAEIAYSLNRFRDLWVTASNRLPADFDSFAIDPTTYAKGKSNEKATFLYRALAAGCCFLRPFSHPAETVGFERFRTLSDWGALDKHFVEGRPLDEIVESFCHENPNDDWMLSLTPLLALLKHGLREAESWLGKLAEVDSADELLDELNQRLGGDLFSLELIWVTREMVRHQLWNVDGLETIGVVPTPDVVEVGYQIGLLPTPCIGSFTAAVYASRVLTAAFGEEYGWEMGVRYLGRMLV